MYDKDKSSSDDFLGSVEVPLEALLGGRPLDAWLMLDLARQFKAYKRRTPARIRIAARYHFSAFNHLASMTWKEDEYEYRPSKVGCGEPPFLLFPRHRLHNMQQVHKATIEQLVDTRGRLKKEQDARWAAETEAARLRGLIMGELQRV